MTAPSIPGVPAGGSVLPASLIANVPLMSVTSSTIASALGHPLRPAMPATGSPTNWSLSPHTPLGSLVSQAEASTKPEKAIVIGTSYPPIPYRIAEAIWRDDYIDLAELLPARLGAPEPTLLELFSGSQNKPARAKKSITTIEEWVLCFNAYITVVAQKRVSDLLAYSSLIVKASRDYEETPWLSYDQHYRRHAAAESPKHWGGIQPEIWTLYFGRAKAKQQCSTCGEIGHAKCGDTSISADEAPTLASQQANTQKGGPSQTQQYPRANKKWSCMGRHTFSTVHSATTNLQEVE